MQSKLLRACSLLALITAAAAAPPVPDGAAIAAQAQAFGDYLAARHAVAAHDATLAAADFQQVLAAAPANADLRLQAFLSAAQAGAPQAATLAAQLPNLALAQMLLANQDALDGRWPQASERLRGMSRVGGAGPLQPMLLAWAADANGETDNAIALLRTAAQQADHFGGAYMLQAALIADLASRPAQADQFYRIAATGEGNVNLRIGQALASWAFRQGQPAAALAALSERLYPGDPLHVALPDLLHGSSELLVHTPRDGFAESYLCVAIALHQQGQDDIAQLLLRYALTMRPDFTAARLMLSDIQDGENLQAAALATLEPIPADDPLTNVVRLRRDAFRAQAGQADAAKADLRAMATELPDRTEPLALLGDVLRSGGQYAESAKVYGDAIARVPGKQADNWRLYYDRGVSYEQAHDWTNAEPDLKLAVELAPDNPGVLNYLGYAWADRDIHLDQARRLLDKSTAESPDDGAIIDSLGWVKYRQGDITGAVADLEHAVELDTEDSEVNGHLGDAYWAAGRQLEAQYQWRRALNLHPGPDEQAALQKRLNDATAAAAGRNVAVQSEGHAPQQN
jgi:tetratricopeptide (TPR) repeat protein